ncbi:uncharacterized protein PG986_011248 [Apiospora aurea]|uniref:Uncharacterized protein n=1 Tax=Apiospora aurea TaxID=335848 RepID=A0ABR1Q4R1_9PEZI
MIRSLAWETAPGLMAAEFSSPASQRDSRAILQRPPCPELDKSFPNVRFQPPAQEREGNATVAHGKNELPDSQVVERSLNRPIGRSDESGSTANPSSHHTQRLGEGFHQWFETTAASSPAGDFERGVPSMVLKCLWGADGTDSTRPRTQTICD